jgi:hypothetical protein
MTVTSPEGAGSVDAVRLLRVYLQDHRAGATFGLALARRCRRANADHQLARTLARIIDDIEEDRTRLEAIMGRLGVRPSALKMSVAKLADGLGRLKPNGRVLGYSPLSRVIDLETLTAGIYTKRHLWLALAAIAHDVPDLDADELAQLIERADSQLDRLGAHHAAAVREAFATGPALR